jgi:hypothetical protein
VTVYANIGTLTAGDDYTIDLVIKDEAGEPLNITNLTSAKFYISSQGTLAVAKDLTDGIEITSALNGELDITLAAEDTEALRGTYEYEVEIVDAEGRYKTPVYGYITFRSGLIANAS